MTAVRYTPRLILRDLLPEDAGALAPLLADPLAQRWLPALCHSFGGPDLDTIVRCAIAESEGGQFLTKAIVVRGHGNVMGEIRLNLTTGEIIYWLGYEYWRHGFATEAIRWLVSEACDIPSLSILYANVVRENFASRRVLEKIGFRFERLYSRHAVVEFKNLTLLKFQLNL